MRDYTQTTAKRTQQAVLDNFLSSSYFILDLRERYGWSYYAIELLYKALGKGYEADLDNIVAMGKPYGLGKSDVISIITKAYELKTQARV